jgi:hypothetical protein
VSHGGTAADYVTQAQMRPRGDKAGRLADADAALRLDPGHVDALLLRAALEQEDKALDAASLDVARAAKLAPGSLKVAAAQMDLMAAQGQGDRALQLAAATLAGHAQDAEAHNLVCWFKATHGLALDSAGGDCEAALRLAPAAPISSTAGASCACARATAKARSPITTAPCASPRPSSPRSMAGAWPMPAWANATAPWPTCRARSLSPDVDKTWAGYGLTPPPGF